MIKTKYLNKFYIKQYIINNNSFQEWSETVYNEILKTDKIIGYIFSVKEDTFGIKAQVLNLYLIKKEYYSEDSINLEELGKSWKLFLYKLENSEKYKYINVFKNPPIEYWLDTKNNWCKKVASEYSKLFNWSYDEIMSEVYFVIAKLYNNDKVYMGNLNYIKNAIYHNILITLRYNKKRLNLSNKSVLSMNTIIGTDKDGDELILENVIPEEENYSEDSLEYNNLKELAKKLLSTTFSEREIEQILENKPEFLSNNIYRRLLAWRQKHDMRELYE